MRLASPVLVVVALFVAACPGPPPEKQDAGPAPPTFGATPFLTVETTGGTRHIEVRSSPQPPVVGVTPFQYVITSPSGDPVPGLTFTVKPWMPQMNHGASVHPTITDQGEGVYLVDNVDLIMSGAWELQTTFDDQDTADPSFDVP